MRLFMMSAMTMFIALLVLWADAAEPLPFSVVPVTRQEVVREEQVNAVLEAVQQATVSAQVSGRIIEVNVDVDDYVPKGAIIARIRDTDQQAAVKAAQARFTEAESAYNRIQDLFKRKLASQAQLDSAEANVQATKASLAQAREQLAHTVVRAPYSGIVVERLVELGEMASVGQPLLTGLSLERLRAVADVPQRTIDDVRKRGQARVILSNGQALNQGGSTSIPGTKLTFSPFADAITHTFKVRIDLPPNQPGLYPGMFTKVAFVTGEEARLLVPTDAVVHRSEVTAVYVVDHHGRVSLRHIRAGRDLGDGHTEILAGLSDGEQVAEDPIAAGIYLKQQHESPAL